MDHDARAPLLTVRLGLPDHLDWFHDLVSIVNLPLQTASRPRRLYTFEDNRRMDIVLREPTPSSAYTFTGAERFLAPRMPSPSVMPSMRKSLLVIVTFILMSKHSL